MRKILFATILLFSMQIATAQISVSAISKDAQWIKVGVVHNYMSAVDYYVSLNYTTELGDTLYSIGFINRAYLRISDFQHINFKASSKELNSLYETMFSFFSDENIKNKDYHIELTLGDKPVTFYNSRFLGKTKIKVVIENSNYFILDKGDLKRLFKKS